MSVCSSSKHSEKRSPCCLYTSPYIPPGQKKRLFGIQWKLRMDPCFQHPNKGDPPGGSSVQKEVHVSLLLSNLDE